MIEQPTRRGLLAGLGAFFVAAPAIVRAASIMPIKALESELYEIEYGLAQRINDNLYGDLAGLTRKAFLPKVFVQLWKQNSLGELINAQHLPLTPYEARQAANAA